MTAWADRLVSVVKKYSSRCVPVQSVDEDHKIGAKPSPACTSVPYR